MVIFISKELYALPKEKITTAIKKFFLFNDPAFLAQFHAQIMKSDKK